ncbi:MAG TPA: hypothetical protein DCQ06_09410, partial [Myxococcales bacterium]|nr:hypothetical protein [Myxococcales bacterium]
MKHLRNPLLFAIAVTLFASPTLATQTRINSLSAGGAEKAYTIRDQANIWLLPQFLPDHFNQVDVDNASGTAYGTMSVRYALTDDAVLLLYGARSPSGTVVQSASPLG